MTCHCDATLASVVTRKRGLHDDEDARSEMAKHDGKLASCNPYNSPIQYNMSGRAPAHTIPCVPHYASAPVPLTACPKLS